ncbi:InlB B-repeat-containing protein [Fannyhessea vaginae]|uniref:InlB B-repeat-containing protein n=1 Tax=Fannyhessea vaginae TaxID=82135 RepID=UPI0028893D22|nr:InlB B-repeat-containing protein [Fannyhessea vaginae]
MTHKTRLQKHAEKKLNHEVISTETTAKLGVAASVAIASTIALAPVAQAETLQATQPDTVQSTPQNSSPAGTNKAADNAAHTQKSERSATQADTPQTPVNSPAGTQPNTQANAQTTPQAQTQPTPVQGGNQVITPNDKNPSAHSQEEANTQVKREKDSKKTYTFTVTYCVEGYSQKQLLQPTEFTFTDDELTKISDPSDQGLYIPVVETKGYRAQRGAYIKENGKYIIDTKKDASVQSYIKIDRALIEAHKNTITSTDTNIISNFTVNYRPKTITYYVRHMLQDPNDPQKFIEFTGINEQITIKDKQGQSHTIRVSKAKGVVGQNLYAQPVTIEGYTPEPNLINSPIPDDEDYSDDDDNNLNNPSLAKKHLVLELRYLLNRHEVSYDTHGGNSIQSKMFLYGMKVDAVPTPTRKGYTFIGWTRETPGKNATSANSSTPDTSANATLLDKMPDYDVHFVAHWKPASQTAQYTVNIWVQKADLPKPDDPTNIENYDFIGQVHKQGKTDTTIGEQDLNLGQNDITKLQWPDANLRGNITNQDDFSKYFMEDDTTKSLTTKMNEGTEPEYFGSQETRERTKIRPDGTTVVNKVFNRRTYELIFANADIEKNGSTNKLFDRVKHITITKDGKEYNDTDKSKLYKVTYRFGQTIHYTSGFPTDVETKRYTTEDDDSPSFGLGWRVANDAGKVIYIDTPPYRFDEKHFIAPKANKDTTAFSQDKIRLFGEKLDPYQRVLVPDANNNGAGSIHVLVKLETEESARRNDDNNREYVASELSYTKDDTLNSSYDYGAPTIEGFEALNKTKNLTDNYDEDDYYNKLADELADVWKKDHPEEEDDPDGSDDEFREWVEQKFPHLVFTSEGSDGSELEENGLLIFEYKRKNVSVRFNVDEITQVKDSSNTQASTQEPYGANVRKFAHTYNGSVTKNPPAAGKHFASSYTFTLNGKTYTFSRPNNIPEDYEFAGWSLDPTGTSKLAVTKADGTPYSAQELTELLKKSPEEIAKVLGNIPLETNGITLYASWKRVDTIHTIDVDMARPDAPEHTLVKVKHAGHAKRAKLGVQSDQTTTEQDCFPAVADRPGYIFNGWMQKYIKPDGSVQWLPFAFTSPILEDLHIKAQWIEDKRVSGTMSHVFLREGYTAEDYKKAKADNNQEELKKMVADIQTNVLTNLRPRSSYAAEAVYRNGNYYPDHTYTTFMVSENEKDNNAEFVYTPYAIRRFTVHYKDAAGHELRTPEVFVSNRLTFDVAHAKTILGYRLQSDQALARQLHFEADEHGTYKNNYDVDFIYDDVRILSRADGDQVTPDDYSRLQFDTQTTELSMQNGKVISTPSHTDGGNLAPFNGTGTGDTSKTTNTLTFDVVKGIKAYEAPLPTPHAKEGYTFTGWTSKVVFAKGETSVDGANRLPVYSEEFPYKVVYTAHFTKTQIAFVGGDSTTEAPEGYYKVTYSADQNGRLSRQISDGQGGTKTETLDTLTNVVVLDKYKDNVIEAPVAVPDKGFEEKGDFEFKGRDAKDRTYIKHFEMIEPKAVEKRYVLPGHLLLQANQSAKDLIANNNIYADADDNETGARAATYEFCDEHGNKAFLDIKTPGEHKIFIKVTAGREKSRISKMVPFFYEVMPQLMFGKEFNAKGYPAEYAKNYKKITFTSHTQQGVLTGKDQITPQGESETLETFVYTGDKAPENYQLDLPSATGKDYTQAGYHWVFRGWRIVDDQTQPDVTDFKTFKPNILPQARYEQITKPTDNIIYQAVYEKIPYITQQSDNGNVPPDSVVVSFQPANGRIWKDGTAGPKVYYIRKGMDISKLDKNGVPIADGDTSKTSILDYLGAQLYGYQGSWSKSSMQGIAGDEHVGDKPGEWLANNAFQEFVAHQTDVVIPRLMSERAVLTGANLPQARDYIENMKELLQDTLKDDDNDGKPDDDAISIEYTSSPSTAKAGTYTVTFKAIIKHKDTDKNKEYRLTSVLKVMPKTLSAEAAETLINSINAKTQANPTAPALTEEETLFKNHYVPVAFESDEAQGEVLGGDTKKSFTRYVVADQTGTTKIKISVPQVLAKLNQKDNQGKGFDYKFVGWEKVNANQAGTPQDSRVDISPDKRAITEQFKGKTTYRAIFKKVYHILDSSEVDTVPAGYVPVAVMPAPGHTWEDGSRDPYIKYVKSGSSIKDTIEAMQKQLSGFIDWTIYDANSKEITDPQDIADRKPTRARTFIARQSELPQIRVKNDVVVTVGDAMPAYANMVEDITKVDPKTGKPQLDAQGNQLTINALKAFTDRTINKRFAGWKTAEDGYKNIKTDKAGTYNVRFGLMYYTDAWDMNADGTPKRDEQGNPLFKTETIWVSVPVRVLPRVIPEQHLPAQGTPEAEFIKHNYTKVMYRVALNDHGRLTSPFTTFYVRRGYTIDPNALLYFDKELRSAHTQGNEEIGVPSIQADTGYTFFDWQKLVANDKGDVVYLAHFHKLPIAHFTLESTTEAEQPFTTKLIGDAQNHPRLKRDSIVPDGIHVSCEGETCTISGTAHINDWKDGEEQRVIELHFEAMDKRQADAYGRTSYGLKKDITVRIVVTRPHKTTYPQAPAVYDKPALPKVGTGTPRHARLPQTSDPTLAAHAAGLLGMGVGMITAVALARKKERHGSNHASKKHLDSRDS